MTGEQNLYDALHKLKSSQCIQSPKSPNFAQSQIDNKTQIEEDRIKYPTFSKEDRPVQEAMLTTFQKDKGNFQIESPFKQ